MKIVLTGSLGHINRPLTETLVQAGHAVTVISRDNSKTAAIEALGATAAIGSVADAGFLANAFKGADVVYCMIPPASFFDHTLDLMAECSSIANNYKNAIAQAGVKQVVHLSSIGAHTDKGNGMLRFHYMVENILRELPASVSIKHLRPVGFYYNLLGFIPTIKTQGAIITNYGDIEEPWVSPIDISSVAAEEITSPFNGVQVRYIASEELTTSQVAGILGTAIGKPDLKWLIITDEQLLNGLIAAGMNPAIAKGYVEMNAGRYNTLYEHYNYNKPVLGKTKLADFAKEFAAAFNQKN